MKESGEKQKYVSEKQSTQHPLAQDVLVQFLMQFKLQNRSKANKIK